ncbi:alcohol dehydrogenase [Streptomyces cellostaticus]|uniref:Alcohol dehydrogenase n=1 Tax=Streptomyces cellostaticus TaxID=67285 RepID=A0A117PWP8_9ACTN|nr:zinc-binding dehydrogenase [Streptomyces cellostaticus]KUM95583.1 alcohol dehydrogenase [Streptomyces cellostaticus]GHI09834.1 oxidoreductase [Streptomyces cellostaticus]
MRALIVDPGAPGGLRLGQAPDPVPGPGQVVVEVRHTSLNAAELYFARSAEPGAVLGFDAAGVVVAAAADGSGPAVGSRVVGFAEGGGFGALRAMDVIDVAGVPGGVDLGEAATLPVAAGTALRALEQAGPLLGRRVLVTGASGGVGGFAVQLAALGGAYVIGVAASGPGAQWVAGLGADEVVAAADAVTEQVDVVIDTVGGEQLAAGYTLLAPDGNLQSVGWAAGRAAVLPVGSTLGSVTPKAIVSVYNGGGLTDRRAQLRRLLALVAAGKLRVPVGWRGPWEKIADAAEALASRNLRGKAVLDVS